MKAIRVREFGGPEVLKVEEVPTPKPGPGQVLVRVKAAGVNPTPSSFIAAMPTITNYNAAGLYGSHSISFAMSQRGRTVGADNCEWITRFSGTSFHLVAGADPICGSLIPGKVVS